jgi:hypothetical protein
MLVLVKYGSVLFDMQKTQFGLDSVHNYRLPNRERHMLRTSTQRRLKLSRLQVGSGGLPGGVRGAGVQEAIGFPPKSTSSL